MPKTHYRRVLQKVLHSDTQEISTAVIQAGTFRRPIITHISTAPYKPYFSNYDGENKSHVIDILAKINFSLTGRRDVCYCHFVL